MVSSTGAGWVKNWLGLPGSDINMFSAHSTKSGSTSKA